MGRVAEESHGGWLEMDRERREKCVLIRYGGVVMIFRWFMSITERKNVGPSSKQSLAQRDNLERAWKTIYLN